MSIASAVRCVLCVLGFALTVAVSPSLRAQTNSTVADGFDPNTDAAVFAMTAQPDGKILLGGRFTKLRPNGGSDTEPGKQVRLARVFADGRIDASFSASADAQVSAIVLQPDGKILIGGEFTHVNDQVANRVARLNANGTLDTTFKGNIQPAGPDLATSLTPEVHGLALQSDGKIIVGGGFVHVEGGKTYKRVLRLNADGTLDTSFVASNPDNMVLAVAVTPTNTILIGGGFKLFETGGADRHDGVAKLAADGTLDASFSVQTDTSVWAIELLPEGGFLIGGDFTSVNPSPKDGSATAIRRIAKLKDDGSFFSDTFFGDFDGGVRAIKVQPDGRIVVGGSFASSRSSTRPRVARLLPNGLVDSTFVPAPNQDVYALVIQPDGSVVMGGAFITLTGSGANPILRNHVARVSPIGTPDATFQPDANGRVRALAVLNATSNKGLLIGGTFTGIAGESHSGLARIKSDGSLDRSFKPTVNGTVLAAAEDSQGRILIGGTFTRVNGFNRPYVARLSPDGTLDEPFNPAPNGAITAIAVDGTTVYLGGNFSALAPLGTSEPVSQTYIARINENGSMDINFKPTLNNDVRTLLVQSDHKVIIGGSFTSAVGHGERVFYNRYGAVRLNQDGTVDPAFHPNVNGTVYDIAQQTDGSVIIVGAFQQVIPDETTVVERHHAMRIKADNTLDAEFDPRPNDYVNTVTVLSDNSILMGGRFTTLAPKGGNALPRDYVYLAHFTAAGAVDEGFNADLDELPGNEVIAVAPSPTAGQAIVAGAFTRVGGANRTRLFQVSTAGVVDASFNTDAGTATGAPIEAITMLSDESVLVAGAFSGLNGTATSGLARFDADGTPELTFVPSVNGTVHAIAQFPTKGAPVSTQRRGFAWLESNGQLRSTYVPGAQPTEFGTPTASALESSGNLLIASTFTIDNAAQVLARFKPDGTIDASFKPQLATGTVSAIAVQSDGKIIIGGTFNKIGETTRDNIARLNADGTLDTTFDPKLNNSVSVITLQSDGKIIVGGSFSTAAPNGASSVTTRFGILRLNTDGTLDTGFDPAPNAVVTSAVVLADNKILIGGSFTAFSPNGATTATNRKYLARINADGTLDTIDFNPDGVISKLVKQSDNKVIVVGGFTSLLNQGRNFIARLNADAGTLDTFNPNPNGSVLTASVDSTGRILIGGNFTSLAPGDSKYDIDQSIPRFRAARLLATGEVDPTFNPSFNSTVSMLLAYPDGSVVALGVFTTIQPSGTLLVGGAFSRVNRVEIANLALFSNDGSVSATFLPNPNGEVYAILALPDGRAVVGGAFTSVSGQTRNRLVRYNADDSLDAAFNPSANGTVYALARQSDGKLIVGGAFTTIGGQGRAYLARLNTDGSVDGSFSPAIAGAVRVLALQSDGKVVYAADGTGSGNTLGRLNADGSVDGSFSATQDGRVNSIATQVDGHVVIGGTFTKVNGANHRGLARLNNNGSLDTSITSQIDNGEVTALTVQPDGKILFGGTFTKVDGLPRFGLARLAATSAPTQSFTSSSDRSVITWTRTGAAPEVAAVVFEQSLDGSAWTTLGQPSRVGTTPNWQLGGLSLPVGKEVYIRATATVPATPNASSGIILSYGRISPSSAPVINSATAVSATTGSSFIYNITATGANPTFSTSTLPPGLTLNGATISGTPTQAGIYTVTLTATNTSGSTSKTLVISINLPGSTDSSARLINLSVRAQAVRGTPVLAGFVVRGGSGLTLLVRGIGPSLTPLGVTNALAAPNLKIYNATNQLIHESTAWNGAANPATREMAARLGAFAIPDASADAATVTTLGSGGYTIHVSNDSTTAATALAELYDATPNPAPANSSRLVNISARGPVSSGELVTAGFVVSGTGNARVLIRGVGPGLTAHGVTGVLNDPALKLHRMGSGVATVVAENDNWGTPISGGASADTITNVSNAVGTFAFAAGSRDAAIYVELPAGVYTAEVSGTGGVTGNAMVEVYQAP